MNLRIEGSKPPKHVEGHRVSDSTVNFKVDEREVYAIYVPVGEEDGETVYRRVGEERKA